MLRCRVFEDETDVSDYETDSSDEEVMSDTEAASDDETDPNDKTIPEVARLIQDITYKIIVASSAII